MFTVIIPLYNKQHSVGRAISSVLAQQHTDFELIVVDDGSTDESFSRCQQFSDPRLKLLQQNNQGVAAARNAGAQHATRPFLCFLDADDQYAADFLLNIGKLIALRPDAALYCCAFDLVNEQGLLQPYQAADSDDAFVELTDFFAAYSQNRRLICASSFAVPRDKLFQLGGFPAGVRIGEDIYLWCQAALSGAVMHCSRRSATVFRNAENRTIHLAVQPLAWHSVVFLRDRSWAAGLHSRQIAAVDQFIRKNTLISGLGALAHRRPEVARGYAALLWPKHPGSALLLWLGAVLPLRVFVCLRSWRNRPGSDGRGAR